MTNNAMSRVRAYEAPKLVVYGDLRKLTQAKGVGFRDGGPGSAKSKSSGSTA